jgi:hypothetical protein
MRTGNLLIYSATEGNFCISPPVLPRCRRCRAPLGASLSVAAGAGAARGDFTMAMLDQMNA